MKSEGGLAYLSAEEMAEADKATIEEFGIDVLSLMENAGLETAVLARRMLGGSAAGRGVCCLVGKGNNGGDGLVAGRHLCNWGAQVTVVLGGSSEELKEIPAKQFATIEKMGIRAGGPGTGFGGAELLLDALLGYGSKGNPREPVAGLIRRANASGIPILAADIPSGLDATTGEPGEPCIGAKATVTFGLPKTGFLNPKARRFVGELYLADISMLGGIYRRYSMDPGIFAKDALTKVW